MFKFNNDRRDMFRIETVIYMDQDEKRTVSKKPLVPEAGGHIEAMYRNQKILQSLYPDCYVCKAEYDGERIWFEYIQGILLSDEYEKAIRSHNKKEFISLLLKQKKLILSCLKDNFCDFVMTDEYREIFGNGECYLGQKALKCTNFEFTSHNIVECEGGRTAIIDYEYVFDFPIPIAVTLYHCVIKTNLLTISGFDDLLSVEEMMNILQIENTTKDVKESWDCFISFYNGPLFMSEVKNNYLKGIVDFEDIRNRYALAQQEIAGHKNYISILNENLIQLQKYIDAQKEEINQKQEVIDVQTEDIRRKQEVIDVQTEDIRRKQEVIELQSEKIEQDQNVINMQIEELGKTQYLLQELEKLNIKILHLNALLKSKRQ